MAAVTELHIPNCSKCKRSASSMIYGNKRCEHPLCSDCLGVLVSPCNDSKEAEVVTGELTPEAVVVHNYSCPHDAHSEPSHREFRIVWCNQCRKQLDQSGQQPALSHDDCRHGHAAQLQELPNHLKQLYMTYDQQQSDLVEWMNGAQNTITNILSTPVLDDNSTTQSQLQKLQSEQNQLVNKVDHVRDLAVELISKKVVRLVEPKLTAFNQCWIDLDKVLKSAINRYTQTVSSSTVDCQVERATAALTQLLHEDVSTSSVQDEQLKNTLSDAVVEDAHVSQELLVKGPVRYNCTSTNCKMLLYTKEELEHHARICTYRSGSAAKSVSQDSGIGSADSAPI